MKGFEHFSILGAFSFFATFSIGLVLANIYLTIKSEVLYHPLKARLSIFQSFFILIAIFEVLILAYEPLDFLFYFSEFFKALLVLCYMEILLKILGFENLEGKRFSQAQVESILITQNEFKSLCYCFSLKNQEEVHWFILKNRISVIQYCIISLCEVIIAVFLKFYDKDNLAFGVLSPSSGFMWLLILKMFSFTLLIYNFSLFSEALHQASEFSWVSLKHKSNFMVVVLALTELQVVIIAVITNCTGIYSENPAADSVKLINLFYAFEIIMILTKMPQLLTMTHVDNTNKKDDVSNIVTELSSVR